MKVLFISNLFPSGNEPTRGMFNKQVVKALSEFCEVSVVSPRPWWTQLRRPAEIIYIPQKRVGDIEAVYPAFWGLPRTGVRMNGELLYRSLRKPVHKLNERFAFDAILVAWAYPDGYAAARLAQEFGCPVVTNLMGSDINDLAARDELREKIRWTLKRSDKVIAVSGHAP